MMRVILRLLKPYPGTVATILAATLVQILMGLAAPWPLKIIIDNVVGDRPAPWWITWLLPLLGEGRIHIAIAAGIMTVLIAAVTGIASYTANYYTESLGQWVANDMRTRIFHRLQQFSLGFYDHHRIGAILNTMVSDVSTIQTFASYSATALVTDIFTIVGMIIVMSVLRWDFALIALTAVPFLAYFVYRVNNLIKSSTREVRERQSDLISILEEDLEDIEVVQAFDRQDIEERNVAQASQETVTAWLRARSVSSLLAPVVGLVVAVSTALVLWRGSLLILSGAMTVGTLTVFLAYLSKFFGPVRDIAVTANSTAQVSVGIERIRAIVEADYVVPERPDATAPAAVRGEIEFDHVAFGYDPDAPVLRDVTFTVNAGEMIGIVGPTGSGKSTVLSLIPRFRDTDSGHIRIDGIDVRDYQLHPLRQQIGFVFQDTVLFRGTVRENIALGRPEATDEEIVAAAKLANAHEFVVRMRKGYDSLVGDRGMTLSGGQRQRVGIARAFIRDSPILLLDEPTAALDAESEELVIDGLERLMAGRTVLVVAHRLSTIRDADRIIVIKDGSVAEQGSHDELLDLDGVYAGLHRIQYR